MKVSESCRTFIDELVEHTEQNPNRCYQCAKCSAGCPVVSAMDLLPHQVIRYLQLGLLEELLDSCTPWICASCFTCAARCPRDLDLARMMEGVRLAVLRRREGNLLSPADLDLAPEKLEKLPAQALVSGFRKHAK